MESIDTKNLTKEEWLLERHKGLGGSDAGAVLGVNPYKTPLDLYEEKIAEKPLIIPDNPAMKAGRKLEEVVAKWYEETTGERVMNDYKIRKHPKYPFLLADIDRIILSTDSHPTGILEIKTTANFKQWEEKGIPDTYYAQIQHYFMVTGYEWGAFAVLESGRNFYYLDVTRDEDYIEKMMAVEIDFWLNHVQKQIPPEPINKADVIKLWPESKPEEFIEVVPDVYDTYLQLKQTKEQIKQLKAQETNLTNRLAVVIGEADGLTFEGKPIVTFKTVVSNRFNTKRLKEENPEIYEDYIEEQISRSFVVK